MRARAPSGVRRGCALCLLVSSLGCGATGTASQAGVSSGASGSAAANPTSGSTSTSGLQVDAASGSSGAPPAGSGAPSTTGAVVDAASDDAQAPDAGISPGDAAGGALGSLGSTLTPNPMVSRGKPFMSPQDSAKYAFDGLYAGGPSWISNSAASDGTIPDSWVSLNVGQGPTKLLLLWHSAEDPDYTVTPDINFGVPTDYVIDVSADGTTWSTVVTVDSSTNAGTTYLDRGHSFDFTGMSWVRMTLTKAAVPKPAIARIAEIDVFDVSRGEQDTWLYAGGGPTRFAYNGQSPPSFADNVHAKHPAYYPAMIDIADAQWSVQYMLSSLDSWLTLNSDFHFWVLNYGLFEANNDGTPGTFAADMQTAITKLTKAGKNVIVPHLSFVSTTGYANIDQFNAAIDQLVSDNKLLPAPDFYTYFEAHPDQLCAAGMAGCETWTGIEPTSDGYAAMNLLWSQTEDGLYQP